MWKVRQNRASPSFAPEFRETDDETWAHCCCCSSNIKKTRNRGRSQEEVFIENLATGDQNYLQRRSKKLSVWSSFWLFRCWTRNWAWRTTRFSCHFPRFDLQCSNRNLHLIQQDREKDHRLISSNDDLLGSIFVFFARLSLKFTIHSWTFDGFLTYSFWQLFRFSSSKFYVIPVWQAWAINFTWM